MRRQGIHIAEEIYGLASRLPWWAGLLSAFAAYWVLHPIATTQMPTSEGGANLVLVALAQLVAALAQVGEYLVPAGFLLATAVSAFNGWKRRDLRISLTSDATGTFLRGIRRADFQLIVQDALRAQGYESVQIDGPSSSRGADFALTRDGRYYLVQCRFWKAWKLEAGVVKDFQSAIASAGADGGFVVTSGHFTPEARRLAEANGIGLIDARRLKELIETNPTTRTGDVWMRTEAIRSAFAGMKRLARSVIDGSDNTRPPRPTPRGNKDAAGSDFPPNGPPTSEESGDGYHALEDSIGRELGDLIRSDDNIAAPMPAAAPPGPPREHTPRKRPKHRRFRLRLSKIADFAGILAVSAGIWAGYQWFESLPTRPDASPWDLLGTGRIDAAPDETQALENTDAALRIAALPGGGQKPLGQFNFGGSWEEAASNARKPASDEPEPVVEYRSITELEAAFNAKYVPPPECYDWDTNDQMVRCGNHRMRARRAFIESGGRMTAEMISAAGTPSGYLSPPAGEPVSGWRLEQAQRDAIDQQWAPDWDDDSDDASYPEASQAWAGENDPTPDSADETGVPRESDWQQETWAQRDQRWTGDSQYQPDWAKQDEWQQGRDWRRQDDSLRERGWIQEQQQWQDRDGDWRRNWPEEQR